MSPMNLQYDHVGFKNPFHVNHVDDAKDERVEIPTVLNLPERNSLSWFRTCFSQKHTSFIFGAKGFYKNNFGRDLPFNHSSIPAE